MDKVYRVAIIGTGRMGGLIEDELSVNQFSSPYGHFSAYQHIQQHLPLFYHNTETTLLNKIQRFCTPHQYPTSL